LDVRDEAVPVNSATETVFLAGDGEMLIERRLRNLGVPVSTITCQRGFNDICCFKRLFRNGSANATACRQSGRFHGIGRNIRQSVCPAPQTDDAVPPRNIAAWPA
jgi:hypothetical protein